MRRKREGSRPQQSERRAQEEVQPEQSEKRAQEEAQPERSARWVREEARLEQSARWARVRARLEETVRGAGEFVGRTRARRRGCGASATCGATIIRSMVGQKYAPRATRTTMAIKDQSKRVTAGPYCSELLSDKTRIER